MRLTLHPQGRHRPTPPPWPLVQTWETSRTNYQPKALSLGEWLARLRAAVAGRNTVDPHPDTVGRDQQGEPWQSLTGSQPKQGHASNSR
jgi:hypothetical protein